MQKIVPCLWFDHTAAEAVSFYLSAFPTARVTDTHFYPTEGLLDFQAEFAGKELTIGFEIDGYRFLALNAGPEFKPNPSVSFMLNFDPTTNSTARQDLDTLWEALSDGGTILMPLDSYAFSEHYGWVQDRFGISWQLILTNPIGEPRPFVTPTLLFGDGVQNRASDALAFYGSTFPDSRIGTDIRYESKTGLATPGSVMYADICLFGQWFALMDAGAEQDFTFDCGVSLMLECSDQAEIDHFWGALSSVPQAEQCGWCADQFGLSWQVVPANMDELMTAPDSFSTLMAMKKIEIDALR